MQVSVVSSERGRTSENFLIAIKFRESRRSFDTVLTSESGFESAASRFAFLSFPLDVLLGFDVRLRIVLCLRRPFRGFLALEETLNGPEFDALWVESV